MPDTWEWIANTSDGVMAADGGRKIILWNSAAKRILGFRAQEALGRPCYEILGRKDSSGRLTRQKGCNGRALAKPNKPGPLHELLTYTKDGQEIWLSVTTVVAPTRRKDFAVIHLFRDASRKKEVELFIRQLLSGATSILPNRDQVERESSPLSASFKLYQALTARELEVLRLLASGASTKAISENLCISPSTVKNHTQNILSKLKAHSRLEAVALSRRYNLL